MYPDLIPRSCAADLRVFPEVAGQLPGKDRGMLFSQTTGRSTNRYASSAILIAAAAAGMALAGCANSGPAPAPPTPADTATTAPAPEVPGADVDQRRAGQIVTEQFGGRVLNVEADQAHGEPAWEVEAAGSRQGRIEVDVSRVSGAILELEHD
jgi:uncharacterized membrane protein YkoI